MVSATDFGHFELTLTGVHVSAQQVLKSGWTWSVLEAIPVPFGFYSAFRRALELLGLTFFKIFCGWLGI